MSVRNSFGRFCSVPWKQRFYSKVALPTSSDACWEWLGHKDRYGYGLLKPHTGRLKLAHRLSHELLVGPIPAGLEIDHLCRNPGCVNPEHLEPVTHRENDLRGVGASAQNAVKTTCPQGHPYDEENTYRQRGGGRVCRTCKREWDAMPMFCECGAVMRRSNLRRHQAQHSAHRLSAGNGLVDLERRSP